MTGRGAPLLLALALAGAACGTSTKLTTVWTEPSYRGGPLRSLLVLGVAREATTRRSFEDRFSQVLSKRGTAGVASYTVFPTETRLSEAQIAAAVRERGLDGLILTRLLEVDEEQRHVPPSSYVVPSRYGGYGYYGYYGMAYDVVHQPGYTYTTTVVRLETLVYDAGSGKLVWGAHSDTFDPRSVDEIIGSVTKEISRRLARDGLLPGS